MSYLPTARGAEREPVLGARIGRRWDRLIDRGHRLAIDAAARPYRATGAILLLNVALIAAFILVGDLAWAAAIGLALAIGISRVYLGAHYPTDVLAGWLTGGILVVGSWTLCARLPIRGTAPAAA